MFYRIDELVCVIPAYQPGETLVRTSNGLVESGFQNIIVVDDGSGAKFQPLFQKLATYHQIHLLSHPNNQGKGAALKTAFQKIFLDFPEALGCITLDADGQHLVSDVVKVSHELVNHPNDCILGIRDFQGKNVPPRSRFGNQMTAKLFQWLFGIFLQDTQTGLRGIPISMLADFLRVPGKGYEFEMGCLLHCAMQSVKLHQVPIETVYEPKNSSSHFRVIRDSLKVYGVLLLKLQGKHLPGFPIGPRSRKWY